MACNKVITRVAFGNEPELTLCISNSGSNVDVNLTLRNGVYPVGICDHTVGYCRMRWTMYLQRNNGGTWTTIGTRTGYVARNSPSPRTFTNVARPGRQIRAYVRFNDADLHSSAKARSLYTPNIRR